MKTLEQTKAEFNYWFPEWFIEFSDKKVKIYAVIGFMSGCAFSLLSKAIMWIFAVLMAIFVILAFYGMITRELDNYRIRKLCKENGWTIEQWNS